MNQHDKSLQLKSSTKISKGLLKFLFGTIFLGMTFPALAHKTNTLLDDVVSVVKNGLVSTTSKEESAEILKTVPVVTKGPRPGGFIIPPSPKAKEYPGQWSFLDFVTGKNRTTKPVSPYAPFALKSTPASDINFRYLDKPNHEKDIFDTL